MLRASLLMESLAYGQPQGIIAEVNRNSSAFAMKSPLAFGTLC
jgi:hypothetical protein